MSSAVEGQRAVETKGVTAIWEEPPGNRRIFEPPLSVQRYKWVQQCIEKEPDICSVTDFGCGNGRLMNWLKTIPQLERINFVDVDKIMLEDELDRNFRPTLYEMLFGRQNSEKSLELKVYLGDSTEPDDRFIADCFVMVEVIEHMLPADVELSVETIFGQYQPRLVIVTTPNCEFNHLLRSEGEAADKFRHFDHKFEWTRAEFLNWSNQICERFPYTHHMDGVGHLPGSEPFGPCTQIAVFRHRADVQQKNDNPKEVRISEKARLLTENTIPALSKTLKSHAEPATDYDWTDIPEPDDL